MTPSNFLSTLYITYILRTLNVYLNLANKHMTSEKQIKKTYLFTEFHMGVTGSCIAKLMKTAHIV